VNASFDHCSNRVINSLSHEADIHSPVTRIARMTGRDVTPSPTDFVEFVIEIDRESQQCELGHAECPRLPSPLRSALSKRRGTSLERAARPDPCDDDPKAVPGRAAACWCRLRSRRSGAIVLDSDGWGMSLVTVGSGPPAAGERELERPASTSPAIWVLIDRTEGGEPIERQSHSSSPDRGSPTWPSIRSAPKWARAARPLVWHNSRRRRNGPGAW
jgi:hypothetical protein